MSFQTASALHSIFQRPLLSKAFLFRRITLRTIPLISILPIKWMAKLAMGFKSVLSSYTMRVNQRIFSHSNESQMVRPNTMPILANMVNNHSLRNIPNRHIVSHSVRSSVLASEKESSISVPIQRSKPQVATIFIIPFRIISGFLLLRTSHAFIPFTAFKYSIQVGE